ncbi:MAG: STAS domain-containing protein [Xenococcaceae cyanobacterium MO_234.B1]|nr:STAS domain-containing protein [Xenococcaceae cyanobacterium MO_234.B1]
MASLDRQSIPLQIAQNCVVASIQIDLTPELWQQLRQDLLEKLHTSKARGVIIDVSGLEIIDLTDFTELRNLIAMVAMMGAKTVISGLKPGVISALVDLDANIDGINAVLNLDDAFVFIKLLQEQHKGE